MKLVKKFNVSIDVVLDELVELSGQPDCNALELVDRVLSTFTEKESMSKKEMFDIIALFDKHRDIILMRKASE